MENNFKLDEMVSDGAVAVTDAILESKDNKGTTLLVVGATLVGVGLGWLATKGIQKFKKRKDVTPIDQQEYRENEIIN